MGGGGAMRTAAKLAAAIRGVQPVWSASRRMSAASWDVGDWEVTDGGGLVMDDGEVMPPTVVFGGVPSLQEAQAATMELRHAIDKIYQSSNSAECEGSSPYSQVSAVEFPFNSGLETKSCVTEAISNPSVPNHALQAFQLFTANPEAQNVVASISCDPNIWNAIAQNPALQDFFQSQHTNFAAVSGFNVKEALEKAGELPNSNSGIDFVDLLSVIHNVKLTVSEMVCNVSNYFHTIFGLSTLQNLSAGADENGTATSNFKDHVVMGGTFMGLAVLVVLVVALKRA